MGRDLEGANIIKAAAKNIRLNFSELQENNRHLPAIGRIYQTKDHIIWMATSDEGLIEYNGTSFIHYRANSNDSFSLPSNRVNTIYEENDFTLWVSTKTAICKFNRIKKQFIPLYANGKTLGGDGFLKLADGRLLCGTNEGLYIIDKKKNSLIPVTNQIIKNYEGKYYANEAIQGIGNLFYDKNGTIWGNIITPNLEGLASFNLTTNEWTLYPQKILYPESIITGGYKPEQITTWAICADPDGERIWVGGYGTGLRCFYKSTGLWKQFYFERKGRPKEWVNTINAISIKNNNELWVGTYTGMELFNTSSLSAYLSYPNKTLY
jgi:ligand-binding sensor domain-containing protein